MRKITKRARAEQDLIDIWLYSLERWGETQADDYLDELNHGIQSLRDNPEIGWDCGHVRPGHRCYAISRHRVFYRLTETTIEIIRVLHESMDVDRHLD